MTGMMAAGAAAQGKLDARYTATLGGVPIGKGAWVIEITDDHYMAAASGGTTGLLRLFSSGQATGASRGAIAAGNLVPGTYAASVKTDKKTDEVRLTLAAGNVKDAVVEPPQPPHPERVPLTTAHRRGVSDPMSASLLRVAGNPLGPEACERKIAIFDGRLRYDLQLTYKRMDTVKAEKGYQGPAVVCAVYFSPVAGFIPDRPVIKHLVKTRDMEAWLVPLTGTRVVVPFRISIPTPFGQGVLEATQFVSLPPPPRPTATSAKSQQ